MAIFQAATMFFRQITDVIFPDLRESGLKNIHNSTILSGINFISKKSGH